MTNHSQDQSMMAMERCIQNCELCHHMCMETVRHCLHMGGKHAEVGHITLLMDCAQICQISADFMLRHSAFHAQTCGVCADVCERCAQDCERLDPDDRQMQQCAATCRDCTDSCRQMTRAVA